MRRLTGHVNSCQGSDDPTQDDKGRPLEIVSPDGARLHFERKNGMLQKILAPDGTAFEALRDGSGKIRQINGKGVWASYVYGQDGRLKEFRGSDGWFVQYETDNRGRVVKRVDGNNATTHVSYDASGKVEALGAPKMLTPRLTFTYGPASFSADEYEFRALSSPCHTDERQGAQTTAYGTTGA